MHILLNGEPHEMPEDTTLADLLATLDLQNRRFAVEVNEELIPRSEHAAHALQPMIASRSCRRSAAAEPAATNAEPCQFTAYPDT